jgi:DNA (cytosine-5)-methyltransferase 1
LGVDINPSAVETFAANLGQEAAREADLLKAEPQSYLSELGLKQGELDHLHASPPCEAYSVNNRVNGNYADLRFRVALEWAEAFLPKVVTIENVRNLERAHDAEIKNRLNRAGYQVISFKVDAADYGVPQHRKRLFYLGCLAKLGVAPRPPDPTNCDPKNPQQKLRHWVTVREAIGDLPARKAGEGPDQFVSNVDPTDLADRLSLGEYAAIMRPPKGTTITGHSARPLNDLAMNRLRCLSPGQAIGDLPAHLRPKKGFRGAYGRTHPDHPAKTITTGIRGPSHGPFCHYAQDRLITLREAARLQSFPDTFTFKGGRQAQAFQIGNAVPQLLGRAIRRVSEEIILQSKLKSLVLV